MLKIRLCHGITCLHGSCNRMLLSMRSRAGGSRCSTSVPERGPSCPTCPDSASLKADGFLSWSRYRSVMPSDSQRTLMCLNAQTSSRAWQIFVESLRHFIHQKFTRSAHAIDCHHYPQHCLHNCLCLHCSISPYCDCAHTKHMHVYVQTIVQQGDWAQMPARVSLQPARHDSLCGCYDTRRAQRSGAVMQLKGVCTMNILLAEGKCHNHDHMQECHYVTRQQQT